MHGLKSYRTHARHVRPSIHNSRARLHHSHFLRESSSTSGTGRETDHGYKGDTKREGTGHVGKASDRVHTGFVFKGRWRQEGVGFTRRDKGARERARARCMRASMCA
eukprot:4940075-Pleurochrysis_carterae.AAC.1